MPGELYQIYAHKTAIDDKRTAIKGSGFSENDYYCSSREDPSNDAVYFVDFSNGSIDIYVKPNAYYVLGFLALEV